jgi:hypothetical protein
LSPKLRRPRNPTAAQRVQWRGISRIDQPSTRTFGWFVRIGFVTRKNGSSGPKHSKFFGDASHGGPEKALRAARKWRNQQMPKPRKAARR